MIELGNKVKDTITGFMGIATARCEYLHGCVCFEVTGKLRDKQVMDPVWFDESRLVKARKTRKRTTAPRHKHKKYGPPKPPMRRSRPPASHGSD